MRFASPHGCRVCAGLARSDACPCSTHPGASAGRLAGGGEAQEAACGGSKVANPAILSRLPGPVLAVCLQDCKVSTLGRALHRLDQAQATYRAAARNKWQFAAVAKLRLSRGCEVCRKSAAIYLKIKINARRAAPLNRVCHIYSPPRSSGTPHNFRLLDRGLNIVGGPKLLKWGAYPGEGRVKSAKVRPTPYV